MFSKIFDLVLWVILDSWMIWSFDWPRQGVDELLPKLQQAVWRYPDGEADEGLSDWENLGSREEGYDMERDEFLDDEEEVGGKGGNGDWWSRWL